MGQGRGPVDADSGTDDAAGGVGWEMRGEGEAAESYTVDVTNMFFGILYSRALVIGKQRETDKACLLVYMY